MTEMKIWGKWSEEKVNSFQLLHCGKYKYSVPEKYVGCILKVFLTVDKIKIYDENDLVYIHDRLFWGDNDGRILDHFLDQLSRKPNAFKFSKVVQKTILNTDLETIRDSLLFRLGENKGAQEFIQVLLLKRITTNDTFDMAIKFAISYGGVTSGAVSSFINQLEIETTHKDCPKELIPENLHQHSVGAFCIDIYQQLIPDGGL